MALAASLLCSCGGKGGDSVTAELSQASAPTTVQTAAVTSEAAPLYIPVDEAVYTGAYYTGTPKVKLAAVFDTDGDGVCSPKSVSVGFVTDRAVSAEINDWLASALARLLTVRDGYIADCGGADDVHGNIFSRETYESCDIQALNGYISITLGYIDNRAGVSDELTAWYDCETAVFDLIDGRRVNSLSELLDSEGRGAANAYINGTYKTQLRDTLPDFEALGISGDYALHEATEKFTLTSVITSGGEWAKYGLELPFGYEYIMRSQVWRERDFTGLTDFAATRRAVDGFGFASFCENGTRYTVPVSSLTLSEDEMRELTEQRTSLVRELAELYRSVCGNVPASAEYSCYSGGLLSLRVGSEGAFWYFTVKEDGQPLTLGDCLSGEEYTVYVHNAEHEYVTGEKPANLSEYYVFSCYEQPEQVYFNCWSLNETTGAVPETIDITALHGSVSEYCLENYTAKTVG